MSAAVVTTVTAPVASKVVSLHQMGHEEQVKNTDQGNIAVAKARSRKNLLPASELAKVPMTAYEQQLAQMMKQLNALSPEERAKVLGKMHGALAEFQAQLPLLAKAMSGKADAPASDSTSSKEGSSTFDPWNQSILMLYTNFAESQMNQNGQIMNAWQAQQQAQNQTLQEAATAEAQNASKPTESNQPSWWKILLIGLGVIIGAALICTGVGAVAGAALTGATVATVAAISITAGALTAGACYGAAQSNPNGSANGSLVEKQPDQTVIQELSFSNQFWSTISQKTNNQISSGSQTNIVNASSNDTQLGQQASQVIQAMGQVMQTPVAH